jgi:threonyl-tRNA synthetase
MITVTLPDGGQLPFDHPVSIFDIANDIGAGLARAALAGKVNGQLVDTSHIIDQSANIAIIK